MRDFRIRPPRAFFRAACLRDIQRNMPDPLARLTLEALIQALEEAALDLEQLETAECLQ